MTGGRERGSATLELAVLAVGLLAVVALVVAPGRFQVAAHAVEDAARAAARQASISRDGAHEQARSAAAATLRAQALQCRGLTVEVDTSGAAKPAGTASAVTATVTCTVSLAESALPGMPGHRAVEGTFTSPVDTFREQ